MIQSFKCKETAKVFNGLISRKFPASILTRSFNKLAAIHVSTTKCLTILIPLYRIQNMPNKYIKLDHVGKILFEEFMEPYKLSQNALAKAIGVAPSRITDIVNSRRGITVDTDLRLTRLFGLSEGYFLRLQEHIETALIRNKIKTELKKIVPLKRIA